MNNHESISATNDTDRDLADATATAKMAALIAQSFAGIDPNSNSFYNSEYRLTQYRAQIQSSDFTTRINAWAAYASELLKAGKTDQAITELQPLIQEVRKIPNTEKSVLDLQRILAIAYLRLGEQANCITQRNHESCILPITPLAQFQMTQGSETAMQICIDILSTVQDEETIWILNLAAMTIGRYPDGIPEKWRLPESYFVSSREFPRFSDISFRVGIRGQNRAGGACIEDFDGDGWLDIITSSWGEHDPLTFWKNDGQGKFINASKNMQLPGIHGGLNLLHADVNNDAMPDVLVLRGAWLLGEGKIPNSLLLNIGNGRFIDGTLHAGVLNSAPTQTATFADFNLDGWIDLFVGNESSQQAVFENEFYLNNGDGTFRNVIKEIGLSTIAYIKGCVAGDINNDGWPDLYLSTFRGPNMLLLHKGNDANGVPQFENIAAEAGVQEPIISFPTWMFDIDHDGWEDIVVCSYGDGLIQVARDFVLNAQGVKLEGHPRVYRNNGDHTFKEVSAQMGLKENIYTMGCNYGDLDADGYLDFYLGTGNPAYSSVVPNKMFRNQNGQKFEDITYAGGFGHIQKGHAVAFGDLDKDGDEDIFASIGGAYEGDIYDDLLFENPIGQDKSWVVLQFRGVQSNRLAIGTRVKITVKTPNGSRTLYRTVSTGSSFGSSSLQLEIGLGNATAIEAIEVVWPVKERTKQTFHAIDINCYVQITEGVEQVEYPDRKVILF